MKRFVLLIFLTVSTITLMGQHLHDSIPLIAKNASLKKISSEFLFTEGPIADKSGNVFFTDQPNDRIMKWTPSSGIIEYMKPSGRANGLYIDKKGDLYACADEKNQIWKIDNQKKVTIIAESVNGKRFNGPNDLWIGRNGFIYFTDPFYKREYWSHTTSELDHEAVYLLSNSNEIRMIDTTLSQPNGIIGSNKNNVLYVSDIRDRKTYSYTIQSDGSVSGRKLFCNMGSDGMTIDKKGNIYLTGRGVTIFDKYGKRIGNIPVPEPWTANVTFGGKGKKTLFITASKSVYTLKMKVKGQ